MLGPLSLKGLIEQFGLALADRFLQRHEHVRSTQVPIILGDLVLQNQMIPKGVPSQFVQDTVILMQIVTVVGKDQVRSDALLQALKFAFYLCPLIRKEAVAV